MSKIDDLRAELDKVRAENARLRRALQYFSKESNYRQGDFVIFEMWRSTLDEMPWDYAADMLEDE